MNKLTKGAIATAAGVVLLMGGAGTLATWNSSATVGASQTITAGQLLFSNSSTGVWKNGSTPITAANFRIVPGDTITYTQSYTLNATGDNLQFTLAATPGTINAVTSSTADTTLASQLNASKTATFQVASGTGTIAVVSGNTYKVTSAGTTTITITMSLTVPSTADNNDQVGSVTFGTGAITATQV